MDQSGPARKQSLPLPMPRGRRLASASRGPDQGRGSIMKIDGGCHCGYITYEAEADPERPPSAIARLPASLRIGVSHRRPRRRRHIQNHRWRPNHLCKDRRKRRKTGARILPPMWNANLLDCRRDEPKLYSIRVGTVRQRAALVPKVQIWTRSQLRWVTDLASVRRLDRQ